MEISDSENNGIAYGNITKPNSPLQEETLLFKDDPSFGASLSMQNSNLFSLTLNEIQNKSGKSVGSMNMDEFLANLWSVEVDENQEIQLHSYSNQEQEEIKCDVDDDACNNNGNGNHNANGGVVDADNAVADGKPAALARQGSFSIPSPLCKKTVDEVWFEIQKDQPDDDNENTENGKPNLNLDAPVETPPPPPPQRHLTLGEMTLEDFLVKAGIVREARRLAQGAPPTTTPGASSLKMATPMTPMQNMNACLDATFGMGSMMGMTFPPAPHQTIGSSFPGPPANAGFVPYPLFPQNKGYVGEARSNDGASDQGHTESGTHQSKKRIIDGPPEVVVERRQRRMIKNRESAARSRARKQAYTVELELELTQLKEENAKLKQLVEEIEQTRKEEISVIAKVCPDSVDEAFALVPS
ncbi:ABSCISIC ACID-INSENSITIVE 5-like protein 1 isoform X2 [Euphorbia lathyris]|uniref:ABSCISIC ACID-INSENSITIVE 5-like protein 1 isoform X2 n=1 Tax=Euphorbia lathyris TaxID=212925 RepID=UPI0033132C57